MTQAKSLWVFQQPVSFLAIVWIIAFLCFFRHRANAFVHFQKRETSKIWIRYQRGLRGDHKTREVKGDKLGDEYLIDETQKKIGFLLDTERGNGANDGQRHQTIQALNDFFELLAHVDYFRSTGFRIAFSQTSMPEKQAYKLGVPKWNDVEPSFFKNQTALVALNVPNLPWTFYFVRMILCALVPVALFLFARFTRSELNAVIHIISLIMIIIWFVWISLRTSRNRYLQENLWILYSPITRVANANSGELFASSRKIGPYTFDPALTGPLHQLLFELWLMSRFTGTTIIVDREYMPRKRRGEGGSNFGAVMKLAALSIRNALSKGFR